MKRLLFLLALLPLLLAACASQQPVASPAAKVPRSGTPGPPPTPSPTPSLTGKVPRSGTPAPATATVTLRPIQGTLTIKVNVRSGPGTTYASLGLLDAGEKVSISAQDQTGKWYQVLYPAAPGGNGWVTAQYVQIAAGARVPLEATPTPPGPGGRVLQRLNVRSGPGLTFDSLGMLEPDAVVSLTGRNFTASWFQIDYPAGPGGRAWVTAQYIQTNASADLPVLDETCTPVASGTSGPTPIPVTPSPTLGPAYADNDSAANPGMRVTFSASGTRQFTYSSQVSAPAGDPEDWLEFTPFAINAANARLVFSLACSGNGTLTVELWQGGSLLSRWGTLACGDLDQWLTLPADQAYELRLAPAPGAGLRLVDYILTVQNEP